MSVDKVTKSRMFAQWIAENYPELDINSLEDDRGSNHKHGQALDVSGIETHPDKKKILKTALDLGLRIGKEVEGRTDVGGWTGAHYHFDETPGKSELHFSRGGDTGHASMKDKYGRDLMNEKEKLANLQFRKEMEELKRKKPLVKLEDFKKTYKPKVEEYLKLKKLPKNQLKDIQEQMGIKPDGIFGKNTMKALLKYVNRKKEPVKGEDIENYVMQREEHNPVLDMVNRANEEEANFQKTKYDNLSFKDAFEEAYNEKGEGETFIYRGEPILLKKAEPNDKKLQKLETIKKELSAPKQAFSDMLKPYADKMDDVVQEEVQQESMKNFDPRELELQNLIDKGEDLVSKYDTFKEGGTKYQDGTNPLEKLMEDLRIAKGEQAPTDNPVLDMVEQANEKELTPVVESQPNIESGNIPSKEPASVKEETPVVEEKEQFVESPMDKSEEYEAYKKGVAEGQPKDKTMSMADLESEYRKLMEASKEERKTAQWATAATQIASMLDKFSARPVGIKPINFQAEQNPAAMQDLLNLGRLQNQGQLTPYQREMLKLTKDREETREKYFKANMDKESRIANQQQINTMRGFLKDDPTYKKIAEQRLEFDQVGDIIKQAESGNQNAIAALGTKLARAMGEVGVLTDTDVVRYVQGTSWGRQLKTWWEKGAKGELPQEVLEDIKANINTIDSKLKENEQRVFKRAAGRIKAAYPNVEDDMVYGVLGYKPSSEKEVSKTDKKSVEKNSLLEWLEKNPDHPKAEAVREKAKRQGLL